VRERAGETARVPKRAAVHASVCAERARREGRGRALGITHGIGGEEEGEVKPVGHPIKHRREAFGEC